LDPSDVSDAVLLGRAAPFDEHVGIRIQSDCLLEQVSKADGENAGAAANIQEPAGAVQIRLLRQDGFKFR
jgi:hypothetical protein